MMYHLRYFQAYANCACYPVACKVLFLIYKIYVMYYKIVYLDDELTVNLGILPWESRDYLCPKIVFSCYGLYTTHGLFLGSVMVN